ncbi:uncharacterized protein LOC135843875 [Planococcus citri]|uniref:uncharacterized protein LOC135843875 n=1 Tax=Planococcus citri TaxID=170843 RepID=UPI0031F81CC4
MRKMLKLRELVLLLIFAVTLSDSALNSDLLELYDLKVKNNEPTCRLVTHANLPENRRTLAGRGCMCDEECIKYKDCCKDSPYYRPNEQSLAPSHHCNEFTAVYLMSDCPSNWEDSDTKELCKKSVQPLEDQDISMILPIGNVKTREVFGNRHCAHCNNDVDMENWVQFPMGVATGEAPPGYLKPIRYKIETPSYTDSSPPSTTVEKPYPYIYLPPSSRLSSGELETKNCNNSCQVKVINNIITQPSPGILLDIHLYIYNDTVLDGGNTQWPVQLQSIIPSNSENSYNNFRRAKRDNKYKIDFKKYSAKAEEICANAKYDIENKEYISQYNNKNFICRFLPILPENADQFTRRCVPYLERKCPNGYKNQAIKEECSIYTNVVYNKSSKKPYRNKDCARCNDEKEDSVNGIPQDTRDGSTSKAPEAADGANNYKPGGSKGHMQSIFNREDERKEAPPVTDRE